MLCQMRAEGAASDKLTLDQEHVKPLDVFLIKDPSQHTHTRRSKENISLFVRVTTACFAIAESRIRRPMPHKSQ